MKILFALFVVTYVQTVFRNVAYYRHTQVRDLVRISNTSFGDVEPRLHDIGYDIFPDLSNSTAVVSANDVLQYAFLFANACTAVIPYALEVVGVASPILTSHIFLRLFYAYSVGMLIRCPVTIMTSLPGPAAHCIGQEADDRRPATISSLFELKAVGRSCGDLLYSGHMFTATTLLFGCVYYLKKLVSRNYTVAASAVMCCLFVLQIFTVILSRSHYTVDVLLGVIIGCYNWITFAHYFHDSEVAPEENELLIGT